MTTSIMRTRIDIETPRESQGREQTGTNSVCYESSSIFDQTIFKKMETFVKKILREKRMIKRGDALAH